MICFPNAKINLGLNVTEKRSDGFHNIETIFYPIGWNDALEVVVAKKYSRKEFTLHLSGIPISGNTNDNLLYKAYKLMQQIRLLPKIEVYLHKSLPMGAGLGGGSSDAAFFIKLLNEQFSLELTEFETLDISKKLGSDCAFFVKNSPVFAFQKGDIFTDISLDLSSLYIAVIYPNIHSNTKEAYSLITPQKPSQSVLEIIKQPIATWKTDLVNDFETSIFKLYPAVKKVKDDLYRLGSLYASMSGSGSAVFGLFDHEPDIKHLQMFPNWIGKMKNSFG